MVWKSDFFSWFMKFVRVPPYENGGADGVKSAETETESNESRLFIDDMFEYL